jgi:integrase/recombinase XerD
MTVVDLVHAYLAWRKRYQADPATLKNLRAALTDFAEWAGTRDPASITGPQLDGGYLADWQGRFEKQWGREPQPRYVSIRISALRLFWRWAHEMGHVAQNPTIMLKPPKVPETRINWLRADQDRALLEATKTPLEVIVVYILRFTGMRASEAAELLNEDVVMEQTAEYPWGYIRVRESKTASGERIIPVFPELRPVIQKWQARQIIRGLGAETLPFLAGRYGTPRDTHEMYKIVVRVGRRAGVKCSPHTLRRTFGSSILNQDWTKLTPVSAVLGHKSTAITQRSYAALEQATVARALLS